MPTALTRLDDIPCKFLRHKLFLRPQLTSESGSRAHGYWRCFETKEAPCKTRTFSTTHPATKSPSRSSPGSGVSSGGNSTNGKARRANSRNNNSPNLLGREKKKKRERSYGRRREPNTVYARPLSLISTDTCGKGFQVLQHVGNVCKSSSNCLLGVLALV